MLTDPFSEHPFVDAARQFCGLVEQHESHEPTGWLEQIGNTLLLLESTIDQLDPPFPPLPHAGLSDLEKRFELYFRLKGFLRETDDYWSEADLYAGDGYMTGSLADDFADIYFEIKRGLSFHERGGKGVRIAIQYWTDGYRDHWRQHLIDARKQLFDFKARAAPENSAPDSKPSGEGD